MIGIFDDSGNRLAIAYNGLTLNSVGGDGITGYEVDSVTTVGKFDTSVDSDPAQDGAILANSHRIMYLVRIDGVIRAMTQKALFDMKRDLAKAFDPALTARNNPSTLGVLPLTFSVPTADATNFPSGLNACQYSARANGSVIPIDSRFSGRGAFFSVQVLVPTARRHSQTLSTRTGAGTATNIGDSPTLPTLTITMSGAGSATYTIQNTGTKTGAHSLVLNLSGRVNNDVVVVDMENAKITVNGTETPTLYVSGTFWDLDEGANTIAITNGTNASTVIAWRSAWIA